MADIRGGDIDVLLVGAGLQNSLLATALAHHRPGLRIELIEARPAIGVEHAWSFFESDVPKESWPWLDQLIVKRWPAHELRFPGYTRIIPRAYCTVGGARLAERVEELPGVAIECGREAVELRPGEVLCADGLRLRAPLIIDGRGPSRPPMEGAAWQKFLGLELRLARPCTIAQPIVMDATVAQDDGYRFVYVLPFADDRVLVEDTCFSVSPDLDPALFRARALAYAASLDLEIETSIREEQGVLPMPYRETAQGLDANPLQRGEESALLRAGFRGGWYHPATAYGFPVAVRLADCVAHHFGANLDTGLRELALEIASQSRFARLLNRMLFQLVPATSRWRIFERFYRLPEPSIARFYALRTTLADRARILVDHPPFASWFRLPGAGGVRA